jgi:hypothetical protein
MLTTLESVELSIDCNVLYDAIKEALVYARKCSCAQGRSYIKMADFQKGLACCSELGELISSTEAVVGRSSLLFSRHVIEVTVFTMVAKSDFTANDLPIEAVQEMQAAVQAIDASRWLLLNLFRLVAVLVKRGIATWDGTVEDRHSASIEASVSLDAGDGEDVMYGRSLLRKSKDGIKVFKVSHDRGVVNAEKAAGRQVFSAKEAIAFNRSLVA